MAKSMTRRDRRAAARDGSRTDLAPAGKPETKPDIDALFAIAFGYHRAGDRNAAESAYRSILAIAPAHPRTLHYLGVLNHQIGRHEAAAALIARAIEHDPAAPEPYYNLGVVFEAMRRLAEAAEHYRRAIALKPDHANAHLNLGNVLIAENELAAAEGVLRQAVALNAGSPHARYNLGIALVRSRRFVEAIALFDEVARMAPDHAPAHAYLGVAWLAMGDKERSAEHCRRALAIEPGNHQAAVHLGLICVERGDLEDALELALRAFETGDTPQARYLFSRAAHHAKPTVDHAQFRDLMTRAVAERWERPRFLMAPALSLIKINSALRAAIDRHATGQVDIFSGPHAASVPAHSEDVAAIASDRLLRELLQIATVCDHELEQVLTALRRKLLADAEAAPASTPPGEILEFYGALAQQCFCNEYVYALVDGEQQRAETIAEALDAELRAGSEPPLLPILAVAAYMPLHQLRSADRLLDFERSHKWPAAVSAVVRRQIAEPLAQRALRADLPRLTAVEDATSIKVKGQYEANPYPRWIVAGTTTPAGSLDEYFAAKFPHAYYKPIGREHADILIAGCGTGQHAIETARRFVGADVLAIDLSAASLAYALFKTRELAIANLDYAIADILKLTEFDRRFDLIEAVGSLQACADPSAGWRILTSLLNSGGVMLVGLYSSLARTPVNAVRRLIAERNYQATPHDIRQCRQELLAFPAGSTERLVGEFQDFYSMSECRDLVFHVQEYQHTLPEIRDFLAAENLQFLGFALDDPRIAQLYAEQNPHDPAMIDLDAWHRFEEEHPATFAGMYQFYLQKR